MRSTLIAIIALLAIPPFAVVVGGHLQALHPLADSLSHFRLHAALALLPAACIFFIAGIRRTAIAILAAAATGFANLGPALPQFRTETMRYGAPFRFLQANTLFNNPAPEHLIAIIRKEQPDVVTLQEVSRKTRVIMEALAAEYPSQVFCPFAGVGGVAVLAKEPALAHGCREGSGMAWLRIDYGGTPLTIVSLHLHWPYPFRQNAQIDALAPELGAIPRPVLIAGDFNAAPWSHAVARIAEAGGTHPAPGLRFTLRLGVPGYGPVPFLPIDHILLPPSVSTRKIRTIGPTGSDHNAVLAELIVHAE